MPLERVLSISTSHMPEASPDFGDCKALDLTYGALVWTPYSETYEGVPRWMVPIVKKAKTEDCIFILFDRDVPAEADLDEWEW